MKVKIMSVFIIFLLQMPVAYAQNQKQNSVANTFTSPTAGFSIIKPTSWVWGTTEQIAKGREAIRLKDKELEQQMRERANAPLIVILKHQEPFDDLNPSVQVQLRPLGQLEGKSAIELMNIILPTLQRAVTDFTIIEPIKEATLGGQKAAYMKSKYSVNNAEGREFRSLSRLWIVPRGSFIFMVSMSGPQEGPDVSETEFAEVIRSIKIEN
jgi:hypothetical protein